MAVPTVGAAWSKFNAASATVRAAARRRFRRSNSSSSGSGDDHDAAGVARQLLLESRQAATRALAKAEASGLATTTHIKIRARRRLLTWAELDLEASGFSLDTVNILSHVFGAIVFVALAATLWIDTWPWTVPSLHVDDVAPNSTADKIAATAYMLGVAVCFTLSACFHTVMCHSAECAARGMAIDITGVLVLMAGAVVPLVHFGLACEPVGVRAGFYAATAVLGTAAAATTWDSSQTTNDSDRPPGPLARLLSLASVQGPANGHRRAALFLGFAAVSCAGPLLWMSRADPLDWAARVDLWPGVLGTVLWNAVGFVAYTSKFPERRWPRRFDLVGASHQLMHVAVLAAAVTYIAGVHRALAFRRGEGAVCRVDGEWGRE